jgi:DNA-binding CsgD family transcriptional regulator
MLSPKNRKIKSYAFQLRSHSYILAFGCLTIAFVEGIQILTKNCRLPLWWHTSLFGLLIALAAVFFATAQCKKPFSPLKIRSITLILAGIAHTALMRNYSPSGIMIVAIGIFDGFETGIFYRQTALKLALVMLGIVAASTFQFMYINPKNIYGIITYSMIAPLLLIFFLPQLYPGFFAPLFQLKRLGLDDNELHISRYLAGSDSYRDIADDLGMKEIAVRTTSAHILAKTGTKTREEFCALVQSGEEQDKPQQQYALWRFAKDHYENILFLVFWITTWIVSFLQMLSVIGPKHDYIASLCLGGIAIVLHGIACLFPRSRSYLICSFAVICRGFLCQATNFPPTPHTAMFVALGLFMVGLSGKISQRATMILGCACFTLLLPLSVLAAYSMQQMHGVIIFEIVISVLFGLYYWLVLFSYHEYVFYVYKKGDRTQNIPESVSFSPRERELAEIATLGLSYKEMSGILGLSDGTIRVYFSRLFTRVGVRNRLEFIRAYQTWKENNPTDSCAKQPDTDTESLQRCERGVAADRRAR